MTPPPAVPRRLPGWSRLLSHLRHIRVENKGLKLLALLIAATLFAVSRQPTREVLLVGVPLEFRGLAPEMEIGSEVVQTVSVRLRGPQNVTRNLLPNQVTVLADLSNKEPGERVVQLKAGDVTRPEGVEVVRIEPASIKLRLEPSINRQVPVEPRFLGKVAEGYEVYRVVATPPTVEVAGPHSHVSQLHRAPTESIQLDGRTSSFETVVDVNIEDRAVRVMSHDPIRLVVEIGERRVERRFPGVPVRWLDQPPNAALLTPTVEVKLFGPRSALDALQPRDLRVEVSTVALPASATAVPPRVLLPQGAEARVEVRGTAPDQVRIKQ